MNEAGAGAGATAAGGATGGSPPIAGAEAGRAPGPAPAAAAQRVSRLKLARLAKPASPTRSARHPAVDTDDDGFVDTIDPAPNDAQAPGRLLVAGSHPRPPARPAALAAAKAADAEVPAHLERDVPDINGFSAMAEDTGQTIANSTGMDPGTSYYTGQELRTTVYADLTFDRAGWAGGREIQAPRGFLRGTGGEITLYLLGKVACGEGADFNAYYVSIESASVNATTGTWSDVKCSTSRSRRRAP
jgi:hypothetical protein